MKILKQSDCAPIHLAPDDTLALTYAVPKCSRWKARRLSLFDQKLVGKEITLLTHVFAEGRTIDSLAIVELDGELAALGMVQGIAGVFGKRDDNV